VSAGTLSKAAGKYPWVRVVVLAECGTHAVFAAEIGA
jgi:hypothetical protein